MANLSITTAWNETAAFVKREAGLLFPVAFMLIALPVAVMEALMPAAGPDEVPAGGAWMILVPIVGIAGMIGNIAISSLALPAGTSVGEAIGRGARRFIMLLGAGILLGIIGAVIFLAVAILATLLVPGAMSSAAAGVPDQAMQTVVVVVMLLMLPILIYFGARLMLMTPVAAAEEGGPLALIRRSWALTRGHVGKLIAFLLLVGILVGVLSSAVESVAGLLFSLLAGPPRPGSTSRLLIVLVMAALNTVIAAYLTSFVARIYAQLVPSEPARAFA